MLKIIAAEQTDAGEALNTFSSADGQPYALVFGHEVFGVQDDVLAACDACVEIPQQDVKHSLNVSVSIGIVVWHFIS